MGTTDVPNFIKFRLLKYKLFFSFREGRRTFDFWVLMQLNLESFYKTGQIFSQKLFLIYLELWADYFSTFYDINNMRYFDSFDLLFSAFKRFYEFSNFSICKKSISKSILSFHPLNFPQLKNISEGNKQPMTDKYLCF